MWRFHKLERDVLLRQGDTAVESPGPGARNLLDQLEESVSK
jgi:hypothetical protein